MKRWQRAVALALLILSCPLMAATPAEQVKAGTAEQYRLATAAFGLGEYAKAAAHYEKAFSLTPNHALLFNAALSHERAGNVERARILFANYLRLYAKGEKAEDARRHLESKPAKSEDKPENKTEDRGGDKSGVESEPRPGEAAFSDSGAPTPPLPATVPPRADKSATGSPAAPNADKPALDLSTPAKDPVQNPSRWRSPWLWGGVAAVVVGIIGVTAAVSMSRSEETPLWGRI